MGLRDNFRQAAKELMDGPDASRSRGYEPPPQPAPVPDPPAPEPAPVYTAPEPAAPESGGIQSQDVTQALNELESFMNSYNSTQPSPAESQRVEYARPMEPRGDVSIIAPGTIIRGSVESDCDMELYGEVQGDITTSKDLKLKGKIQGNATGGNVELYSIRMVGNVTATGSVMLDADSEVEGDVTAESVILNGKIRGNVQVSKRLALEGSAVICGRVSADKLSVDEGAVIQGEILIGKSMMPPKPAAPAAPVRPAAAAPVRPPVAPVQRPVAPRPAVPKAPAGVAPKAPAAPRPAAPKPVAPKAEEAAGEEKSED